MEMKESNYFYKKFPYKWTTYVLRFINPFYN